MSTLTIFVALSIIALAASDRVPTEWLIDGQEDPEEPSWIVTTIEEKPYVMLRTMNPRSNDDFEGLIPDLMKRIGQVLDKKYTLRLVLDSRYGAKESNGQWSGLIGEVIRHKADFAAAPLLVNSERSRVVDFIEPFQKTGIVVVVSNRSQSTQQNLFSRPGMKFGVLRDSAIDALIRNSRMMELMELNRQVERLWSNEEGIEKARSAEDGNYGFIIEEINAQFWLGLRPCNLKSIPVRQMGRFNYAFAFFIRSELAAQVDYAVKMLKDNGELAALTRKWSINECVGRRGPEENTRESTFVP